ncbi:uncharacterized protein TNCV_4957571 [Trichonephila clavipes]|nr:uncharacterized protein TNCV_4957571 [Trichonephila clavipes]
MDVCKCRVPLRHVGTLNNRRAASHFVWLVEGEERWEASGHAQGFLPLNWGGIEQNRTVICMVLKILALSHNEFRLTRCGFVEQVALVTKISRFSSSERMLWTCLLLIVAVETNAHPSKTAAEEPFEIAAARQQTQSMRLTGFFSRHLLFS